MTCSMCGRTAPELPVTWSSEVLSGRTAYLCQKCTRENLRSIEVKLDREWW